MDTFVAIVHVITALILIALVLLQDSKSNGLGGAFGGGGSNSILGATGGATLAQKMTRGAAFVFAITSLALTVASKSNKSVVDDLVTPPPAATTTEVPAAGVAPEATVTTTLPTK